MATSRNWERFTQPRASLYKGLSTSDTTLNCQQTVWADLVSTLASDFMWTLKVGESGSDRSCSGVITWPTNCAGAENLGRRGRFKPTPSSNRSLDSVGFKRCKYRYGSVTFGDITRNIAGMGHRGNFDIVPLSTHGQTY